MATRKHQGVGKKKKKGKKDKEKRRGGKTEDREKGKEKREGKGAEEGEENGEAQEGKTEPETDHSVHINAQGNVAGAGALQILAPTRIDAYNSISKHVLCIGYWKRFLTLVFNRSRRRR